jgi:hypothetical protein
VLSSISTHFSSVKSQHLYELTKHLGLFKMSTSRSTSDRPSLLDYRTSSTHVHNPIPTASPFSSNEITTSLSNSLNNVSISLLHIGTKNTVNVSQPQSNASETALKGLGMMVIGAAVGYLAVSNVQKAQQESESRAEGPYKGLDWFYQEK